MRQELTTVLFVPAAFDGAGECTVVECAPSEGDQLSAHQPLVRLRAGHTEVEVESPVAARLTRLYVRNGDVVHVGQELAEIAPDEPKEDDDGGPRRSRLGEAAARRAPAALAVALATPALVWPMAWLLLSLAIALIAGIGRKRDRTMGIVWPMFAGAGRVLLWAAVAVAVPALLGSVYWFVTEGGVGVGAALRLAVFEHALRIFAFVGSLYLLRTALRRSSPRIAATAGRAPEVALFAGATAALVWVVACGVLLPRSNWWPADSFRGFVQALPKGLREEIHGWRASAAEAEARAVVRCMSKRDRRGWREPRAFIREDGTLLVGVRNEPSAPRSRSIGILILALQNQLAPHGSTISIVVRRHHGNLQFDTVETAEPMTQVAALLERASVPEASSALVRGASNLSEADVDIALRCSAAAV